MNTSEHIKILTGTSLTWFYDTLKLRFWCLLYNNNISPVFWNVRGIFMQLYSDQQKTFAGCSSSTSSNKIVAQVQKKSSFIISTKKFETCLLFHLFPDVVYLIIRLRSSIHEVVSCRSQTSKTVNIFQ